MTNHEEREEHEGKGGGPPEMVKQFEALSGQVIGCAIEVHRFLGPGLLESSYQRCLIFCYVIILGARPDR